MSRRSDPLEPLLDALVDRLAPALADRVLPGVAERLGLEMDRAAPVMVERVVGAMPDPAPTPTAGPEPASAEAVGAAVAAVLACEIERLVLDASRRLTESRSAWHLLSAEEAAKRLGVSARTVRDMIACGELPSLTVRAARRVHVNDLEAYVAARRAAG